MDGELVDSVVVLLPGLLEHPYPKPIRPYIEWGGILLYVVGGLCLLAVPGRRQVSK